MGPLAGYKIIELAGLGPGPFCGMLLADMGAEVICVHRASSNDTAIDLDNRGKRSIALNLKSPEGVQTLLKLVEQADAFFEGFRPGVVERLGIGPEQCMARNPRLVYGRMTGWGQAGPLAKSAGHDINYIALTGALHGIGRKGERPVPPLNLVGDFGGGSMFLAFGIVCGLLEAHKSGRGQVIDAAMTDGSALLMSLFHMLHGRGMWQEQHGSNEIDGAAHYYDTYETKDGKYISIGCLEPQFYAELLQRLELDSELFAPQRDPSGWAKLKDRLSVVFKTKTRGQWGQILEGTDVCFAPVLSFLEAPEHPHNKARETFIQIDGFTQPAPAPRFSRTPGEVQHAAHCAGEDTQAVLADFGFSNVEIEQLKNCGALT